MDKAERERRLVAMVKEGDKAKSLDHFLDEFIKFSNGNAINELTTTTKDAEVIKADLRAAYRLVRYIKSIAGYGKMAEQKLKENE